MRINFEIIPNFDLVRVPVLNLRAPSDFVGFPSDGGLISNEAPHHQRVSSGQIDNISYIKIPYLGPRSNSGSLALRPYKEAHSNEDAARGAYTEYVIYLSHGEETQLNATVYVTSGLDTDPSMPMEWSLQLDGDSANSTEWFRMLEDPETPGDMPPDWYETVADQVWVRNITFGYVEGGKHTLRWRVNSPEVYLEKIVLNSGIELPDSYLGAPQTVQFLN